MKANQFTMTMAAVLAMFGTAQANPGCETPLTRAQVAAETVAARDDGRFQAMTGEDSGSFWLSRQATATSLTRAEVVAQMREGGGQARAMTGEDSGSFQLARQTTPSARTRAVVLAEVTEARRAGDLAALTGEDSGSVHLARQDAGRGDSVLFACRVPDERIAARVR
ncbi:MAG: DUF4148 domain-containing protein [Burkholderiales bacterium]|nr:DUF4148 domain-containing protein [Burkholderiales bacterium]